VPSTSYGLSHQSPFSTLAHFRLKPMISVNGISSTSPEAYLDI
jgi:hypothetical protein